MVNRTNTWLNFVEVIFERQRAIQCANPEESIVVAGRILRVQKRKCFGKLINSFPVVRPARDKPIFSALPRNMHIEWNLEFRGRHETPDTGIDGAVFPDGPT